MWRGAGDELAVPDEGDGQPGLLVRGCSQKGAVRRPGIPAVEEYDRDMDVRHQRLVGKAAVPGIVVEHLAEGVIILPEIEKHAVEAAGKEEKLHRPVRTAPGIPLSIVSQPVGKAGGQEQLSP